jgi:outer membrane immunogenic protein
VDGGWATARLTASGVNTVLPDAFATRFHDDGWTIGAGWDYALDNNWILGVDYKRIELKKTTRSGVTDAAIPFTITDIDPKINVLTLRLSYKFGDWGKSPVVAKY